MKYCSRYKKDLCEAPSNPQPLSEFKSAGKCSRAKDGLYPYCRSCSRDYDRRRYAQNPNKFKSRVNEKRVKYHPYLAFKKTFCEECNFIAKDTCQLDVDHIDGDHNNNCTDNLRTLCANCHRLKSKVNGDWLKDRYGRQTPT